ETPITGFFERGLPTTRHFYLSSMVASPSSRVRLRDLARLGRFGAIPWNQPSRVAPTSGRRPMGATDVTGAAGNGTPTEEFVAEWRNAAYNCFSSGHKFCREVCPVTQVTRDEAHTPTAFHTNV